MNMDPNKCMLIEGDKFTSISYAMLAGLHYSFIRTIDFVTPFFVIYISKHHHHHHHDDDGHFIQLQHVGYKNLYPYGPAKTA
jgi:hypothetical protein